MAVLLAEVGGVAKAVVKAVELMAMVMKAVELMAVAMTVVEGMALPSGRQTTAVEADHACRSSDLWSALNRGASHQC